MQVHGRGNRGLRPYRASDREIRRPEPDQPPLIQDSPLGHWIRAGVTKEVYALGLPPPPSAVIKPVHHLALEFLRDGPASARQLADRAIYSRRVRTSGGCELSQRRVRDLINSAVFCLRKRGFIVAVSRKELDTPAESG